MAHTPGQDDMRHAILETARRLLTERRAEQPDLDIMVTSTEIASDTGFDDDEVRHVLTSLDTEGVLAVRDTLGEIEVLGDRTDPQDDPEEG